MSKKPRSKKKYKPRKISVSPFITHIETMFKLDDEKDCEHPFEDEIFLLQIVNRTVSNKDLVLQGQVFRTARLLASRMNDSEVLKERLYKGIEAVGAYLSPGHEEFTQERYEDLADAVETARAILTNSGQLERLQAMQAVIEGKVKDGLS